MDRRDHRRCYAFRDGAVEWAGLAIDDPQSFGSYLNGPVRARLEDAEQTGSFAADLRALATTGMAPGTLAALLAAKSGFAPWEVGEALAECLLADTHGAQWPWNAERDKRTPRASLPGADLIGFIRQQEAVCLLVGEVKTSADKATPPQVMYGPSGMMHQLERLVSHSAIHHSLLNWLHVRCKGTPLWPLYQEAVGHYLASGGRMMAVFGLLMRDTQPSEKDLASGAAKLAQTVEAPTSVELQAWYMPVPIDQWPTLAQASSP